MQSKNRSIVTGVIVGIAVLFPGFWDHASHQTAFAQTPAAPSNPGAPSGEPTDSTVIDPLNPTPAAPARSKKMKGPSKNPITTANASPEHDLDLIAWLKGWSDAPHKEATPDELTQLAVLLAKTPLKAPALFDIAHGFHSSYTAPTATLALYNAAANHAHQALLLKPDIGTTTDILFAIERNRADLRKVMGSLVDPHGNSPQDFETLKSLYTDTAQFTPAPGAPGHDPDLDAGGQAAMTGLAQYYTMTGQYDAAEKLLENAAKENLDPARRATLEFNWAQNLVASKHYQEAALHFRRVLDDPQTLPPSMVWTSYIVTLARADQKKDANLAFDQWVRQFHPTPEQAAPVWEQVR